MLNNCLLLLGAFPLLIAIFVLRREVTLRRGGVCTTGEIVDVRQESNEEGGPTFRPIVQFITSDGQEIVWKCTSSGTGWKNAQGKQMQIIYDPQNPQRVIRNHWSGYAWIVLLFLMSALCIVFSFTDR